MDIAMPKTERTRYLQALTFAPSQILSRDIPRDSVYKSLQLRLSGSIITTFASGTPVADAFSIMDNLIPRIDVVIGGSRTVKSVRPHFLHMHQLLSTLIQGERKASAGAAAATDNNPTADGGFTYGTTGQITTVAETVIVSFENMYAKTQEQKASTWLNLKGAPSAELRLTTGAYSSLLGFGNTAPVVYTGSTFSVEIVTREAQDVAPNLLFGDWKQTTKAVQVSAQSTDLAIDLNRGNFLQGLMFQARDGAAGTSTSASGKLANNLVLQTMKLVRNGQENIKASNFKNIQSQMRIEFGVDAKYASNVSRVDGVAYWNMIQDGDVRTALDVRPPNTDNLQLLVNTMDSTTVSYTNPCEITIETGELVWPR